MFFKTAPKCLILGPMSKILWIYLLITVYCKNKLLWWGLSGDAQHLQDLHKFKVDKFQHRAGQGLSPNQEANVSWYLLRKGKSFYFSRVSVGTSATIHSRPHAQEYLSKANHFPCFILCTFSFVMFCLFCLFVLLFCCFVSGYFLRNRERKHKTEWVGWWENLEGAGGGKSIWFKYSM